MAIEEQGQLDLCRSLRIVVQPKIMDDRFIRLDCWVKRLSRTFGSAHKHALQYHTKPWALISFRPNAKQQKSILIEENIQLRTAIQSNKP